MSQDSPELTFEQRVEKAKALIATLGLDLIAVAMYDERGNALHGQNGAHLGRVIWTELSPRTVPQ